MLGWPEEEFYRVGTPPTLCALGAPAGHTEVHPSNHIHPLYMLLQHTTCACPNSPLTARSLFAHAQNGSNPQMGSTVGRVGGRIAGGSFSLDGVEYQLDKNSGNNTLHGGSLGFDKQPFEVVDQGHADGRSWVTLSYTSEDGEMVRC